jgi:hypothetical protein
VTALSGLGSGGWLGLSLLLFLLGFGLGFLLLFNGLRSLFLSLLGHPGVNSVLAVVTDKVGQILNSAGTGVINGGTLATGRVELDGREAADLIGDIVGGGIDLGDGDLGGEIGVGLVESTELLILGSKTEREILAYVTSDWNEVRFYIRLAVSAPRGIELDQNILGIIHDDLLVVVGDHNGDGAIIGLGDGLGLDAGLNLSGKDILDELGDFSGHEGLRLVIRVLLVGSGIVKGESRELLGIKVEVASMSTKGLGIDGRNVDLALELLSQGLEVGGVLVTLLLGLGENVGKRNSGLVAVGFVSKRTYAGLIRRKKSQNIPTCIRRTCQDRQRQQEGCWRS